MRDGRFPSGAIRLGLGAALLAVASTGLAAGESDDGFHRIFDGESLDGWDGNPKFWSVEDGAIVGQTTKENSAPHNTFLIWEGGKPANFELKVEFKIRNHNSGIQYRSFRSGDGKWVVGGYQADIDGKGQWVGTNYGEQFRGVLAKRGQKRIIGPDGTKRTVGSVGSTKGLLDAVNLDGWNEYHIVARGRHLVQKINGRVMSKLLDRHSKWRRKGVIAFQLHAGPPMKVWFRNVRLKKLPPLPKEDKKKVVFVAGRRSHGFAAHEHKAGCKLLAETLEWNTRNVTTEVHTGGWPDDPTAFKGADSLVMYCDGGGGHMVNDHLEQVDKLANKGVGIVALHYGVEVPKGKPGDRFLDWIGGYFEAHRSVNPHWTAEFSALPDHPITTGVEPFSIHDEWYYHMRFRENMEGVTPILTDLPPDSTITQRWSPDQAATSHHGNPDVYKAVVKKDRPQHMAWAVERENGGRGFGFTGGHYHWNWGHDAFRKLVANAIAWSAHATLPRGGVASVTPTVPELMANQDYDPPKGFDPAKIRRKLRKWDEQTVSK